uniref:Uncharacterized protein n=1 Tax=Anguilla anguilla TaxID=7936 RepID=A0A0E9X8M7_ANGAN
MSHTRRQQIVKPDMRERRILFVLAYFIDNIMDCIHTIICPICSARFRERYFILNKHFEYPF